MLRAERDEAGVEVSLEGGDSDRFPYDFDSVFQFAAYTADDVVGERFSGKDRMGVDGSVHQDFQGAYPDDAGSFGGASFHGAGDDGLRYFYGIVVVPGVGDDFSFVDDGSEYVAVLPIKSLLLFLIFCELEGGFRFGRADKSRDG